MSLNVAVQMDPIERINISGDSTFALLLEAQKRGHGSPITPRTGSRCASAQVFADGAAAQGARPAGRPFHPGRAGARRSSPPSTWCCCGRTRRSTWPTSPTTHLLERIHPKTLVVNDPAQVRNAPEKMFVIEFPDLMPPTLITRDLAEIKAFRAEHGDIVDEAALRQRRRGGVPHRRGTTSTSARCSSCSPSAFREPLVVQQYLPGGARRRQAHHPGRRRVRRRHQPRAGRRTSCAPTCMRGGTPKETDLTAREREICARIGPALKRARADLRRHRRDRRLPHRDQRHLADRHPRGEALGGPDIAALIWDTIEAKRR